MKWLKHFIKYAKSVEDNGYRLFILDGYCSHATMSFKNLAVDNRIILLYLPPHTTHKLQPLDVGQFEPLAQYYGQFVEDHIWYGFDVSKREYTSWILQVCKKANSESNILLAFRRTGLVPFDLDLVLQDLKHPKKWPHNQSDDLMEQSSQAQNRPCTPPDQTRQDITIVKQEIQKIAVSNWDEDLVSLFDQLDKGTSSQLLIIQQLWANHEMQMINKVIQATEISNLKKKTAYKKSWLIKTIHSNHWDSDVRQAMEKQKALDNKAEKERAAEKPQKNQEKIDKWIADET